MKLLRIVLLVLVLGLVLAVVGLVTTQGGLRYSLSLVERALPGSLSIAEVQGRLIGPITLANIHYQQGQQHIRLQHLTLDWQPRRLLGGELQISRLQGRGLELELPAAPTEPDRASPAPPYTLPDILLPLRIALPDLLFEDIHIQREPGSAPFQLQRLKLQASLDRNGLSLQRLELANAQLSAAIDGQITPQGRYPLALNTRWSWLAPQNQRWSATGTLNGDLQTLVLRQQLQQPSAARLELTIQDVLAELHWQAELQVPRLSSTQLPFTLSQAFHAGLELKAQGNLVSVQASGHLQGDIESLGAVEGQFRAAYGAQQLTLHELQLNLPERQTRLQAQGDLLLAEQPYYRLNGTWQGLRWPLSGPLLAQSRQGRFAVDGVLEDYGFELNFDLGGPSIPSAQWSTQGRGNLQRARFSQLNASGLLDGSLQVQGEVQWAPALQWQADIQAERLNPARQWPEWPGQLGLRSHLAGSLDEKGMQLSLDVQKLTGKLRERPVEGHTRLAWQYDQLQLSELTLQAGQARIKASGHLEDQVRLSWELDIPTLDDLLPTAQGSLRGHGSVQGPPGEPQIRATLDGDALQWGAYRAASLRSDLAIDLADRQPSQISIAVVDIQNQQLAVKNLDIHAEGLSSAHRLTLGLQTAQQSLSLSLQAGLIGPQWKGRLEQAVLKDEALGAWQLPQAAAFHLGRDSAALGSTCLEQQAASLCLSGDWQAQGTGGAKLLARQLPLQLVQPYLPPHLSLEGQLEGQARLSLQANQVLQGEIDLRLGAGRLGYTMARQSQQRELRFNQGQLRLQLNEQQALQGSARLDFSEQEFLAVALQMAAPADPNAPPLDVMEREVKARLQGQLRDLSLIELVTVEVAKPQGQLNMDIRVNGALRRPQLSGHIHLTEARADIPRLNLQITDLQLKAEADATHTVRITGAARSGAGEISLKGQLLTAREPWQAEVQIDGERFEVARIPEARLQVSPRLSVRIAPYTIHVEGELTVPEARIEPRDISLAKQPSKDVVLVGQAAAPRASPARSWQISSSVRLIAPDSLRFIGYGLDARIGGNLLIIEEPNKLTRARGELHVVKGSTYKAFGQMLKTEYGQLIFADSTLDNPDLNITAVRQVGDIIAGVIIRGTARNPQLTLFSTPAMDEANILSYITLGRPMNRIGQAEGQSLANAANTAGLVGGDYLASYVGRRFGLEEARLETRADSEAPWLVLGTYLSPRLYVRYGVNLFEPGNSVLLRYQLSEHWQVQGETGSYSGTDLIYSFERP